MTTQDAYEAIRAYFTRPDARIAYGEITNDDGETQLSCVYSGKAEDGAELHCAVGCLIPPALYKPEWETRNAQLVLDDSPELEALLGGVEVEFLLAAQSAHDGQWSEFGSVKRFVEELDELAQRFGLEPVGVAA